MESAWEIIPSGSEKGLGEIEKKFTAEIDSIKSSLNELREEIVKNRKILEKLNDNELIYEFKEIENKMAGQIQEICDRIIAQDEREKNLRIRNYFPNQQVSKFMASKSFYKE